MNFLGRIYDFNKVAGNISDRASEYDPDLGFRMLQEELTELNQAIVDGDRTETLDALGDIANVALGEMCKQLKSADKVVEAMNRICESNLSKLYAEKDQHGKVKKGEKFEPPILIDLLPN